MHQPSRTPAGAGNGLSAGGMHTDGGDDGGAGEWITIEAAAAQLGVAPRTAYDYRRQGKLQYRSERHGQKMRYFTTVAWTEDCRQTRVRWKDAVAAPVPEPAPAQETPAVESDRTPLTVARSILGEDAPEEALAGFAAEINDYRRNIALLHPHARLLLVREYYRRVERSVRQIEQLLDGGPCAGLVAAVVSVLVLTGVGLVGA